MKEMKNALFIGGPLNGKKGTVDVDTTWIQYYAEPQEPLLAQLEGVSSMMPKLVVYLERQSTPEGISIFCLEDMPRFRVIDILATLAFQNAEKGEIKS